MSHPHGQGIIPAGSSFPVIDTPSPNHGPRAGGRTPELLILHYTGMPTCRHALDRLCDSAAQVSAHYTVDEDGTIHAHVPEDRRAWHAGVSSWRGTGDVNGRSIGVEIVNPGHEHGYRPFPAIQMQAVATLCLAVIERHHIRPENVLGHSDVAPARKEDPGELFDWEWLAAQGIGLIATPEDQDRHPASSTDEIDSMLARFGYDITAARVLLSFQRHYHRAVLLTESGRWAGVADGPFWPESVARLRALLRATGR